MHEDGKEHEWSKVVVMEQGDPLPLFSWCEGCAMTSLDLVEDMPLGILAMIQSALARAVVRHSRTEAAGSSAPGAGTSSPAATSTEDDPEDPSLSDAESVARAWGVPN